MTSAQRQGLNRVILDERERELAKGWTTKYRLWDVVKAAHPDLVADWKDRLADERGLDLCHKALVATVSREEQMKLPMLGEPRRTYTVPEGPIFRQVPVEMASLGDVDDDLEVSAKNRKAVNREHRAKRQRRNLLWSAPGAHRSMTVVEALKRLHEKAA